MQFVSWSLAGKLVTMATWRTLIPYFWSEHKIQSRIKMIMMSKIWNNKSFFIIFSFWISNKQNETRTTELRFFPLNDVVQRLRHTHICICADCTDVSCQRTAGLWLVRVLSSRLCSAPLCLVASDVSRCSWNEADSVLRGGICLFRVVCSSLISDRSVSLSLCTFPLSLYLHEVDSYSCSDMLDACRRVLASVRTTYECICWRARQTFAWRSV